MEKEVQIMDPTTPCIPVTDEDTVSPSLQSSVVKDMNEDDREQGSDTESVDLALSQVEFQKSNLDVDPEPVSTAKSGDLEASGKRESGETEQSESLLLLRQQSIDPACMKVSSVETISLSSQDEAVSPGHLGQGHLIKGQVEGHIGEVQGQNSNTKDLPLTEDCVVLVTQEDQAPAGVPNPSMFNQMKGESSQNHDAPAKMVDAEEDVDKSCSEVGENVVAELSEKTKSPVKIIPESDENICSEKEEVGTTASCPLEKLEYPHLDVTLHIKKSNRKTFSLDPVTPTKPGSEPSKPGSEKVKRTSASKFVLPSLDDSLFENTPLLSPLGDNLEMPSVGESQYNIHGSNPSEKLGATCDMNLKDCQDSQGSGSNMGKDVQLVTLCMEQSTVIDGTSRGSQGSGFSQEKIAPKANEENNRLNASFESPCVISDDIVPATEGASRDESPAFIAPAKCCKLYEKSGSTEVSPAISVQLNQGAVHMDAYENSSVEDDRYKRSKSKKRKSETEGEDTNNEQSCKRSRSSLGHGSKVTQQSQVLHQNSRHENKSSNTSPQDIPDSFKAKSEITINSEEPNASNNARVPNIEVELTDENGDISDDLEQGEEEEGRLEDLISKEYDSISMTNFVDPSCEILEPVNQKSPSSTTGLDEELDNDSTCGSLADDVEDGDLDNGVKVGGLDEGVIDLEDNDLEPVEDKDEVIDVDSNSSSDSKHSGGCLERKPKVVNIRGRRILESDSSSEDGEAEEEETIEASAKQLETQCNESRYKQDIGDLASQEDEVLSKSDKLKVGSRNLASQGETKSMKTTSPSSRLSSRNHRKKLSDLAVCSDDEDEADHQRTSSIEFSHVPEGSHTWPQSQSLSILQPLGHIPTNKELRLQNENTMDDTTDDDELPDIHPPSKKSPRASTSKSYSNTPTRKQSGKIPMMENGNDFQSPGSRVSCNAPSVGRNDFVSPVTRLGIPTIGKRLKSPLLLMTSGTRNQSPRPGVSCNTPSGEKSEFLSPLAKEKVSQLEKPEPSPYPSTDSLNKGRGHKLSNQQNLSDDEEHIEEHDPKYPRDTSESETPVERNYSEDLFTAEKAVEETEEDNRYPDSSVSTEKDMQGEGQSANRYPTSSFSSESEALLTTQQQRQTEAELERLQREMERLKAALNQGVRTDAVQSQTDKKKDAAEDNIRSSDEEPDNMSVNDSGDDLFVSPRPPSPPPVKVAKETSSTSHVERTPEIQKLTEFIDHYKSKDGTTVSKTTQQANTNNSSETRKSKSPCVIKDTPDRTTPGSVRNSPGSGKNTQGSGDCKMSRESSPFRKESTCLRQNDPQTLKTNRVQCSGNQERTRNHGGQEKPETSGQLCSGWTKEVVSGRTGKVMSIVATGLGKHEISTIKNFGDRFGGKFWAKFNSGTTHVIVKPDVKHPLACERTLKYFMGIAGRRWVVSYKWIEDCLNQDKLIPETRYEIRGDMVNGVNHRGPQRARQTSDDQLLLRGYEICCAGGYTGLAIDDLKNLVELCGGATVQDPSMFSFQPGSKRVVLIQPSEHGVDRNKCDKIYKKYSAMTLNREWLLDSVALYRVQHWGEYVLCSRKLVKDDDTEVIDID
ncbi:uncharacterized protein LOC106180111 [Lingula anatina]|uniref:Uncharacterized protein LOC106180111 n=1 Tax=Lingula anatina TaxID=7574 RepID=A0A1S3KB19_LINAN|nr:uncharacterized protein LOC106180111 [Lingula anatina]|eukprot:XP_013419456.1 uncharacterized protein LOC106180111 [Lingula anatina]